MKIELIRLKFNDTHSYKYKPFKHCCDEIQNDKAIVFTGEDLVCNDISCPGIFSLPALERDFIHSQDLRHYPQVDSGSAHRYTHPLLRDY